jgi:hypothetical protein
VTRRALLSLSFSRLFVLFVCFLFSDTNKKKENLPQHNTHSARSGLGLCAEKRTLFPFSPPFCSLSASRRARETLVAVSEEEEEEEEEEKQQQNKKKGKEWNSEGNLLRETIRPNEEYV